MMIQSKLVTAIAAMVCAGVVPWGSMASEPAVSVEKVSKEARETLEATKKYTARQKEAFQKKAHEELVAIQQQINKLHGKLSSASQSTRAELQQSLEELEKNKRTAKDKLDELRGASDAKWHDMKEGMNTAINELKRSYQNLLSRMP